MVNRSADRLTPKEVRLIVRAVDQNNEAAAKAGDLESVVDPVKLLRVLRGS